jgi:hypothetical protein
MEFVHLRNVLTSGISGKKKNIYGTVLHSRWHEAKVSNERFI